MALDLNKFSGKDKSEIFHSSGYAQLGQGNTIGSAGGQTFQQRQAMSNGMQERTIGGYHRSKMGMQRGRVQAKRFTPPTDGQGTKTRRMSRQAFNAGDTGDASSGGQASGSRQAFNAGGGASKPPTTFREPPSRGYNPYA